MTTTPDILSFDVWLEIAVLEPYLEIDDRRTLMDCLNATASEFKAADNFWTDEVVFSSRSDVSADRDRYIERAVSALNEGGEGARARLARIAAQRAKATEISTASAEASAAKTSEPVPKFTPSYMLGGQPNSAGALARGASADLEQPPRVVVRPPHPPIGPAGGRTTMTAQLDGAALREHPAVPFTAAPAGVAPRKEAPFSPAKQSGETEDVKMLSLEALLPFVNNAGDTAAPLGWSLGRYASLCIDLLRAGLPEDQVLAAAELTRAQRAELDAYWQRRLREDPALRSQWKAHADRREAQLRAGRGT